VTPTDNVAPPIPGGVLLCQQLVVMEEARMAKSISIEFDGYWRDENKGGLPARSGIYCVYECTHNVKQGTVSIHKLIYIGEAENVNDRIAKHEKCARWLKHVGQGNERSGHGLD